jgi:hypothetical protein
VLGAECKTRPTSSSIGIGGRALPVVVRFFFCEAIGTAATPGLLCRPRVIVKMIVEKQMECRLAGETSKYSMKTCPSATLSTINPT